MKKRDEGTERAKGRERGQKGARGEGWGGGVQTIVKPYDLKLFTHASVYTHRHTAHSLL